MHGEGQREKQGEGQSYINRDGEMESHKGGYRKRRGSIDVYDLKCPNTDTIIN